MDGSIKQKTVVSFIIPALNSANTLSPCLKAIFDQTTLSDKIEVLLLDNGSSDRTTKIAEDSGATVINAPGLTIAALRNLGADLSKGKILAFVDSDCVIASNWLESALPHFEDPHIGAVGSPTRVPEDATWVQTTWYQHRKGRNILEFVEWLPTENLLIRKQAFEKVKGFNETLITCEDVDFCYRLGVSYKILKNPELRSVHLGEARELGHFFKKEKWRGQGNIKSFFSHGLKLSELPSLMFPIYYLIGTVLSLTAAAYLIRSGKLSPFFMSIGILVVPPLLLSIRTTLKINTIRYFLKLNVLYFTYAMARMTAILPGLPLRRKC